MASGSRKRSRPKMNPCRECRKYGGCLERRGICTSFEQVDREEINRKVRRQIEMLNEKKSFFLRLRNRQSR